MKTQEEIQQQIDRIAPIANGERATYEREVARNLCQSLMWILADYPAIPPSALYCWTTARIDARGLHSGTQEGPAEQKVETKDDPQRMQGFYFGANTGNHCTFDVEAHWAFPPSDTDRDQLAAFFRTADEVELSDIESPAPTKRRDAPENSRRSLRSDKR